MGRNSWNNFTVGLLLLPHLLVSTIHSLPVDETKTLERLAFGSCAAATDYDTSLFDDIAEYSPDLWIWLGDAAYVTTDILDPILFGHGSPESVVHDFDVQKSDPAYLRLTSKSQISGVWDDHDYNESDGDKFNPTKKWMQEIYLDFLDDPEGSPRRSREGIYTSYTFGSDARTVTIILLDTRYFNDPITGDTLGEAQWEFLDRTLSETSSAFTIIASSVLILPDDRVLPESLSPTSRQRLLELIHKHRVSGVVFLSGDIHTGQMMRSPCPLAEIPYQLWELNSSGLTHTLMTENRFTAYAAEALYPSEWQQSPLFHGLNFGTIEFDWTHTENPTITLSLRTENSEIISEVTMSKSDLSFDQDPFKPFEEECYCRDSSRHWRFAANIFGNLTDISKLIIYIALSIISLVVISILAIPLILFQLALQWMYRRRMRQLVEERKEREKQEKLLREKKFR